MEIPVSKIFDVTHLLYKLGKPIPLRQILDQTLASGIADYRLLVLSGLAYSEAGQPADGGRHFEEALRQLPGSNSATADLKAALEGANGGERVLAAFEQCLDADETPAETRRLAAYVLVESKEFDAAMDVVESALDFEKDNFQARKQIAHDLWRYGGHKVSRIARAERVFRELYEADPEDPEVCLGLGRALMHLGQSVKAEPCLRRAFELRPEELMHCTWYLQCLVLDDKHGEIVEASDVALEHHPRNETLLAYRENSRNYVKSRQKPKAARWPQTAQELSDLETAIRKFVFSVSVPPRFMFSKQDNIVTLGSCFAENVARALRANEVDAYNITIGESINSTYANLAYMKRVAGGPDDEVTATIRSLLGRDPAGDRGHFEKAAMIIYTLGVAPCFFSTASGEFMMFDRHEFSLKLLNKEYVWRNTSVEENKNNIKEIIDTVRAINAAARLIFTVSPIPLGVSFDYESALVADCVSKSTLRAAVDEVIREAPSHVMYWPTFEVFRWLGAYTGPVYGADDGSSAHASEFVVNLIFKEFFERFCVDWEAGGSAGEPASDGRSK
ncbi:MAG: GSCFA domain-containing protein [Rhodospirillales bacterium]|jgi:tetratricopeptide (TPR) repeat protein|nr:GSCFA domain-containing protein [Rhodospirillales bacterium]MDP6774203.1 GSCFA domain-containing protein [Rhodospirillales bacterium]